MPKRKLAETVFIPMRRSDAETLGLEYVEEEELKEILCNPTK